MTDSQSASNVVELTDLEDKSLKAFEAYSKSNFQEAHLYSLPPLITL